VDSEQLNILASELEADELVGAETAILTAEDITPVLEALWERGVDFAGVFAELEQATNVDGIEEVLKD